MKIQIKTFLIFALCFISSTVVGTLSHELGHISVAEYLGYKTELHHASMSWYGDVLWEDARKKNIPVNQLPDHKERVMKYKNHTLAISIGGPLQTILTGTLGLILLLYRRKKIILEGMKAVDWIGVFLSLFWLRKIFNLIMSLLRIIYTGAVHFGGDEGKISLLLNLWQGTIPIIFGLAGLLVSIFIVFALIPKMYRFNFIASGFFGGISAYILWIELFGKYIIP